LFNKDILYFYAVRVTHYLNCLVSFFNH